MVEFIHADGVIYEVVRGEAVVGHVRRFAVSRRVPLQEIDEELERQTRESPVCLECKLVAQPLGQQAAQCLVLRVVPLKSRFKTGIVLSFATGRRGTKRLTRFRVAPQVRVRAGAAAKALNRATRGLATAPFRVRATALRFEDGC